MQRKIDFLKADFSLHFLRFYRYVMRKTRLEVKIHCQPTKMAGLLSNTLLKLLSNILNL